MAKAKAKAAEAETNAAAQAGSEKRLRIEQVRSTISTKPGHAESVRGLGLRRLHQVVERPDNPAVRGILAKVGYLLRVEEVER